MGNASGMDQPAEIVREYGPFSGAAQVHGVSFDGSLVWFAGGEQLQAFDPASGKSVRALDVACDAGTAFDGRYLFQIAEDHIHKIDPATGKILSTIPAPGGGRDSGLAWAEGTLWVGQYRDRKIHQIDPDTGAILRTIESNRFVTGVTWVDGELWHGTMEGDVSDIRRVDPATGEVLTRLAMPEGMAVSGLESDQGDLLYAGGARSGRIRAVRKPRRGFVARVSVDIAAPASKVWNALIDPELIKQYMAGATVRSDWKRGSPITWKGEWKGKPYEDKGMILRFEPERALSYSHFSPLSGLPDTPENHHTVTIQLSSAGGTTRIRLSQDNNPTEEARAHSEKNWAAMLEGLKKLVEAG